MFFSFLERLYWINLLPRNFPQQYPRKFAKAVEIHYSMSQVHGSSKLKLAVSTRYFLPKFASEVRLGSH